MAETAADPSRPLTDEPEVEARPTSSPELQEVPASDQTAETESDGSAPDAEPTADDMERSDAAPWSRRSRRGMAVLTVLAVLLVLASAVLGVRTWRSSIEDERLQEALHGARQVAINLTSINYQTADADLQRLLDSSTGQFRSEFDQRTQPFVDIVRRAQVVTTGTVVEAGIDTVDDYSVRTLIALNSQVRNAQAQQGESRSYRLAITMQQVDDRWLASKVEFIA